MNLSNCWSKIDQPHPHHYFSSKNRGENWMWHGLMNHFPIRISRVVLSLRKIDVARVDNFWCKKVRLFYSNDIWVLVGRFSVVSCIELFNSSISGWWPSWSPRLPWCEWWCWSHGCSGNDRCDRSRCSDLNGGEKLMWTGLISWTGVGYALFMMACARKNHQSQQLSPANEDIDWMSVIGVIYWSVERIFVAEAITIKGDQNHTTNFFLFIS